MFTAREVAKLFDVPLWLIDPSHKPTRRERFKWWLKRRR